MGLRMEGKMSYEDLWGLRVEEMKMRQKHGDMKLRNAGDHENPYQPLLCFCCCAVRLISSVRPLDCAMFISDLYISESSRSEQ